MRFRLFGFPLALAIFTNASSLAQQPNPAVTPPPASQEPIQQSQTIILRVNLVDVLFTVLDRRNKLVPSLEKPDFKVLDDMMIFEPKSITTPAGQKSVDWLKTLSPDFVKMNVPTFKHGG